MPYPLPLTRTEAYLAYKAGVIQQSDLKPSLAVPRNGIDAWLAYWTGLAADYPKREDGTPHILQEEEAYIAYLCGVINEYPEKCLRRVGAYLRYLISARWGRPDHPLNREELYLSLIKTQVIPSGDPSSDITIEGTCKAPFVDVKMYGDTFQQSYTGKNLCDGTIYKTGYVINTQGEEIPSNNAVITNAAQVEPNTTYTASIAYADSSPDKYLRVAIYTSDMTFISRPSSLDAGEPVTFTTPSNARYIRLAYYAPATNAQLELGSTATSYEPFVGGQPSPNPSYPQDINVVTGTQTISINGTNYPISLGSLELCKIGTHQDYIFKDGNDWKVHKATGSDSASNRTWIWAGILPNGWYLTRTNYGNYGTNVVNVISEKISGITRYDAPSISSTFITMSYDGNIGIRNKDITGSSNVTQFTDWLNSLNTTWRYALTTPTDTTITDQTLIAQLDSLVNGGAEDGTTYIKVNATDPNLPGLLYVEAPKYE